MEVAFTEVGVGQCACEILVQVLYCSETIGELSYSLVAGVPIDEIENGGSAQLAWSSSDIGNCVAVRVLHVLVETATAMGSVLWEECGSFAQNGSGLPCAQTSSNPRSSVCGLQLLVAASLVRCGLLHCRPVSQLQVSLFSTVVFASWSPE